MLNFIVPLRGRHHGRCCTAPRCGEVRSSSTRRTEEPFILHPHVFLPLKACGTCETFSQKYKGRVVLWEGHRQMRRRTQKRFSQSKEHLLLKWRQQDIWIQFSDFFGVAGEADDAVSACTQVHRSEVPSLPRLREKECPQVWIRLPTEKLGRTRRTVILWQHFFSENYTVLPLKHDTAVGKNAHVGPMWKK